MSKKQNKRKQSTKSNIGNIFLIISIALLGFAVVFNKLIGWKIALIVGLSGLLLFLIGLLLKRNGGKIFISIINILLSAALIYTQVEFNRLFNYEETESHIVSLVVMANSPITEVDQAKGKTFANFSSSNNDSYDHFLEVKGNELLVTENLTTFNSVGNAVNALYDDSVEVLVLDEGFRDIIMDTHGKFDTDTRVIAQFSYEVDKESGGEALPETNVEIPALPGELDPGLDPDHDGTNGLPDTDPIEVGKNSFTIVISGVDTYSNKISAVSRSDVNMLMSVNMDTHQIALASIPRDAYLPISCFNNNWDKVTHSGLGGVRCTQQTFANYFNMPIDYYAKVNFTSLIRIVDIVGPIQVNSHYTFTGHSGSRFVKGRNTLNGTQALEFSRTRKTVPGGDFTRGIHQMEVIKAIIAKLSSVNSVLNLTNLVNAVSANVDTNIPSSLISRLVSSQLASGGWNVVSQSQLNGKGIYTRKSYKIPNQNIYVMVPYQSSKEKVRAALAQVLK